MSDEDFDIFHDDSGAGAFKSLSENDPSTENAGSIYDQEKV